MFISYDSQLTAITKLPNFQRMIDSEGGLELTETKKGSITHSSFCAVSSKAVLS